MKRFAKIVVALMVVATLAGLYVLNPRLPTPHGEQSAALYRAGVLRIATEPIALVDASRPTRSNGDFAGSPSRALNGFVWYPAEQGARPFPLVVYSHGFMSSVAEPEYLVNFLVPKGYAVVAVDYPLSHGGAPGGPTVSDVVNQPGDISFVIDALLARSADAGDRLYGLLDPSRIAAVGLSLGGLTTQLAAYHRDVRDPRLAAAVSIAGPSAFLERSFFQTREIPFMMIAGSTDAIVPYEANAAPMPAKVGNGLLVTLDQGSHVGFAGASASRFFRWAQHPDKVVCPLLLRNLDRNGSDNGGAPVLAPDPEIGISTSGAAPCTTQTFERAMRPADQQMLTRLALYAFLEKVFAHDDERRRQMDRYLTSQFTAENPTATVLGGAVSDTPTRSVTQASTGARRGPPR
jgi:dienelactone hydrolase